MVSDQTEQINVKEIIPSLKTLKTIISDDPGMRAPILSEMWPDIEKLAFKTARTYTDHSCPILSTEDLSAECMKKMAELITKNRLDRINNRKEAFKFIKSVFGNRVKSIMHQQRLTKKRGCKPTDENSISLNASTKNVALSMDDEESGIQIKDEQASYRSAESYINDIAPYLTPIQILILKEYDQPGKRTQFLFELDQFRHNGSNDHDQIKPDSKHMAEGLGLSLKEFERNMQELKEKLKEIKAMENDPNTPTWNRAVALLEETFQVHVPSCIDKMRLRRLMTVAARDQYKKVEESPDVRQALVTIGARVPEVLVDTVSCFGVLYQRNNRMCAVCGLKRSCETEAKNFGLGDITISPRLLGTKSTRIPAILAEDADAHPDNFMLSPRDEQIYTYLNEKFKRATYRDSIYFKHHDLPSNSQPIFQIETEPTFRLKFNRPAEAVSSRLVRIEVGYFVPEAMLAEEVIKLIDQHADATFKLATEVIK